MTTNNIWNDKQFWEGLNLKKVKHDVLLWCFKIQLSFNLQNWRFLWFKIFKYLIFHYLVFSCWSRFIWRISKRHIFVFFTDENTDRKCYSVSRIKCHWQQTTKSPKWFQTYQKTIQKPRHSFFEVFHYLHSKTSNKDCYLD